ncbi:two-component sensor histidine kinase [Novosphingobium hassiacum]|uniref:histidine kinase n=1 Tax=Novosphingobium hassiacum TaxID=173676 RepID=A0A7W6EWK0_9SPHN|nr:sensor histidine kinase [Novosphingobium hassiacum]MBB3861316.1 two-component sensor histidine kinase [Novosphingobium hassiacum]
MGTDSKFETEAVESLVSTPGLADALESDRFKQFLDHVPVAIAISELRPSEKVTYCNFEFERMTGVSAASVEGGDWTALPGVAAPKDNDQSLADAVFTQEEYLGAFVIDRAGQNIEVDAWSNTIENDEGQPIYRLVALAERSSGERQRRLPSDADHQLQELQHRVKNNLQMITALIRMEARNFADDETGQRFDRLAGRIGALALLYDQLSGEGAGDVIDLGTYVSRIASAVMEVHATEGVRLELAVDSWPVSLNVAMPTGLVINELMTNALKHAFVEGEGGTIRVSSLVDDTGCCVIVEDDGIGLPEGASWPQAGKMGAIITHSLRQNAGASLKVRSSPGSGVRVEILFSRDAAAPEAVQT